jgi:hypothetical protein
MAKITINIDEDRVANALALWFENGDALRAFEDSNAGASLAKTGTDCPDDCDVEFDESSTNVYHTITII